MPTDPLKAVRVALADYLRTYLVGTFPDIAVHDDWPGNRDLADQTISVITPGKHPAVRRFAFPVAFETTATSGHQGTTIYAWGMLDFNVQVDVWTRYQDVRDTLTPYVTAALNRPAAATMAGATDEYPHGVGLTIPVPDLWDYPAHYQLEAIGDVSVTTSQVPAAEYRAIYKGLGNVWLLDETTVYVMERIVLYMDGLTYQAQP